MFKKALASPLRDRTTTMGGPAQSNSSFEPAIDGCLEVCFKLRGKCRFGCPFRAGFLFDDGKHATAGVANGGGGVQTIDRLPVFAAQGEFVAVGTGFSADFADDRGAL